MGRTRTAGFTLIELIVTIAIVAILLAVALPGFQGSMRSNQLATSNNQLISSISAASTAARKGSGAGICATANGTSCAADWNQGWLVWVDNGVGVLGGNGVLDAGETVIQHVAAHPTLSLTAGTGTIVFNRRGEVPAGTAFTLQPSPCPSAQQLVTTLTVNASGQVKTAKSSCP